MARTLVTTRTRTTGRSAVAFRPPQSLLSGLVAYWKLDDAAGTSAADATGNGNTGTVNGTGALWGTGKINGCAVFDGTDNYVELADSTPLRPANVTVSAWINPTVSASMAIVAKNINAAPFATPFGSWFLRMNSSTALEWDVAVNGARITATLTVPSLLNAWHHVLASYDGSTLLLWCDGRFITTASAGAITYAAFPLDIGAYNSVSPKGGYFTGSIDEVGLWSKAVTTAERSALWGAGKGVAYPFSMATRSAA